ncbi:MAG: PQQ-binding-like beta-propeller repeat protein [bacterium]
MNGPLVAAVFALGLIQPVVFAQGANADSGASSRGELGNEVVLARGTAGPAGARVMDAPTAWNTFMGDAGNLGVSALNFPGPSAALQWRFRPDDHVWSYEHGAGPWSASAATCYLPGRALVLIGSYDHNLYALEMTSGEEVWRFTAGGRIDAAPAILCRQDDALVFVAACDRTIYALEAATGRPVWTFEVYPWSPTVPPATAGSPCLATIDGESLVLCSVWINDHKPFANVQRGELLALTAETGSLRWRRTLSSTALTSPAVGDPAGEPLVFIAAEDGRVHALKARTGETVWDHGTSAPIHASCSYRAPGRVDGASAQSEAETNTASGQLVVGNDWGMLTALNAESGQEIWTYKAGHAIHATAALLPTPAGDCWLFGSFDRRVHAISVASGKPVWIAATGDLIRSSALVTRVAGEPAVAVYSLDRLLYLLDGASGEQLGSFETGGYLWPLYTRGESIGSAPCPAQAGTEPLLILPADDGVVYAVRWQR